MKKWFLIGLSVTVMLMSAGCGSAEPQSAVSKDDDGASIVNSIASSDVSAEDDPTDLELDENAPEHITMDSISDATAVPLYQSAIIDKKNIDFKCGEVRFPSQLYVEKTLELHSEGKTDFNEDDLMVKEYFQDNQKQYLFAEADGTLPATRPATKHVLSADVTSNNEPYTL